MKHFYSLFFVLFFYAQTGNAMFLWGAPSISDKLHYDLHCKNTSLQAACLTIVSYTKQGTQEGQLWTMVESLIQRFNKLPLDDLKKTIMQETQLQKLTGIQKKSLIDVFKAKKNLQHKHE